jgi:hypothetical protein
MIANLQDYLPYLQAFLFQHHKGCSNSLCLCDATVAFLSAKNSELSNDRPWY